MSRSDPPGHWRDLFADMLAATVIGIMLIPGLFERMSEWRLGRAVRKSGGHEGTAARRSDHAYVRL